MAAFWAGNDYSLRLISLLLLSLSVCVARKHGFTIKNEARPTFELSKFGFLRNGVLKVEITELLFDNRERQAYVDLSENFGFSLVKTASDGVSSYMEQHDEKCIIRNPPNLSKQVSLAVITLNLTGRRITVQTYGSDFLNLHFESDEVGSISTSTVNLNQTSNGSVMEIPQHNKTVTVQPIIQASPASNSDISNNTSNQIQQASSNKSRSVGTASLPVSTAASTTPTPLTTTSQSNHSRSQNNITEKQQRQRREAQATHVTTAMVKNRTDYLPLEVTEQNGLTVARGNFVVHVKHKVEEGLYNLYFHDCHNYKHDEAPIMVNLQVSIVEDNNGNFLSAGEEPLPYMFGVMSAIFFCTAFYWLYVLKVNRQFLYKVHYMMFVLILLKAMDLVFQAVNFHFISVSGTRQESWAVLYYITHLLKGALLFTTIVLIGTGYFFVKHVLSDRDKKIFIIVIPLQILANTAQIVMDSTEEAKVQYHKWKQVFIMVDLLCCGAILFPVVWSIKHLQEASKTDGKAALNLVKLKLFRHFYVMIVCYIYFTRIIVALVEMTVPFQYIWLDEFLQNTATLAFFVLTGYKFRPAPDNPYLHVPQTDSDDEIEMDEVVTTSGMASGVTRVVRVDRRGKDSV